MSEIKTSDHLLLEQIKSGRTLKRIRSRYFLCGGQPRLVIDRGLAERFIVTHAKNLKFEKGKWTWAP